LSTDRHRRGALLLRAAEAAGELGRGELTRSLLRQAGLQALGPVERARSLWLGDTIHDGLEPAIASVDTLVDTAEAMTAHGELDLALKLLTAAADRCQFGNLTGDVIGRLIRATDRTGVEPDDPRRLRILSTAAPLLCGSEVLSRLSAAVDRGDPDFLQLLVCTANNIGAAHEAAALCAGAVPRLREHGRLAALARCLASWSWAAIIAGDFAAAMIAADEAARLAAETNQPVWRMKAVTAQATLAALRGDVETAEAVSARIEDDALPRGTTFALALVQFTRGTAALGHGLHAEAYRQLRRIVEPADPAHHDLFACYAVGDLVEAAVHSGHGEQARVLLRRAENAAALTPSPWLRVSVRYAQVLLADEHAELEFKHVLDDAEVARWPFLRARIQLAYGQWLRRERRTQDARVPLRAARDAFDALGTPPWSERARRELRAAGENSDRRAPSTLEALTAQELHIVRLAAEGLSNREIGRRLYLSHRTVESHLYHAFPKLGINSRAQLRERRIQPTSTEVSGEH
jgi:ATP/maltotriose-dependent transcriptional regulator MalT